MEPAGGCLRGGSEGVGRELLLVDVLVSVDARRVCWRRSRWRHDEQMEDMFGRREILLVMLTAIFSGSM